MTSTKSPQDRKPKTSGAFRFQGTDGKTYTLPSVSQLMRASTLSYGDFLDAVDGGDAEVALFSLRLLHKADLPAETRAALRGLPISDGLQVAAEWQSHGQKGQALPE